jgi:hypothetical protein
LQHCCGTVFGCTSRSCLRPWFSTINLKVAFDPLRWVVGYTHLFFVHDFTTLKLAFLLKLASFHPFTWIRVHTYLRIGTSPWSTPLSGWAMISHYSAYLKSPFILRDEFRNTPPIYWRFAFTPPPLVTPLRCKSKSTLVVPWLVRHQGAYKLINYLSQKKHQCILTSFFLYNFKPNSM